MRNKIFTIFFASLLSLISVAQIKPARLIVRGDDMGFSHAANEALIKTWKQGIERSLEVLVPSPWFPEAVKLVQANPGVDVGIHLALTSEWETIKWRPITYCPSITDSDGYFYPMIWPNKNYPDKALKEHAWKLDEIEKELRAQIELGIKKMPRVSHLSSHMGYERLDNQVATLVKKLAKEYNLDIDLQELNVKNIGYKGPSATATEKLSAFLNMLDSLRPGNTYLFVDHPALDGAETRAIYHIGYENVAADRQGVTDLYTNPLVLEAIKKKNIQLISYADLKK
ncbi:MAG: ChbG/HpnK family deacetylase [Ginsengibacter sp.]